MLVYQRVAQTSSGKLKQPGDVSWLSWEFQELVPLWFSETPFIKAVLWKMIQRHTRPCRCWIWRWQLTEQGWEVLSCSIWFTHGIVWKGSPKSTDSWSCSLLFHIQIAVLFFFPVFESSTLRNCWNLSDSVLGDGDKIGGVEFLHVSTLSSVQIKRNRKAKPWLRLHKIGTWSQQLCG